MFYLAEKIVFGLFFYIIEGDIILDKLIEGWYINHMGKISRMLREIIEEREKISIRKVAREIGVDHGSLYRGLKNSGNPEGKTIEKILDYLGYDLKLIKRKELKLGNPSKKRR